MGLHALLDGVVRTGEAFWARDLLFVIERHGSGEQPGLRFLKVDHSGARQSPDLPPVFESSRTASITIALSTDLTMS